METFSSVNGCCMCSECAKFYAPQLLIENTTPKATFQTEVSNLFTHEQMQNNFFSKREKNNIRFESHLSKKLSKIVRIFSDERF